ARIGFPAGWTSGGLPAAGQAVTPTVISTTADGPEARLPLDPGQFGMVQGTGPPPAEATGLEIKAEPLTGGQVSGTVRNTTPYRLESVAVFAGTDTTALGTLDAGEQRTFVMPAIGQRMDGGGAEFRIWGGRDFGNPESAADIGLWQAFTSTAGVNFMSPDALVAGGWTRDYRPEVRVGGRTARPEGRTLVLSRQEIDVGVSGAATMAARREIVREPFNRFGPPLGGASVVRFTFPPGADTSKLVLRSLGAAEVWQDGAWRPAACEGNNCAPAELFKCPPGAPCPPQMPLLRNAALTVPSGSVRDGVVYVRIQGSVSSGGPLPITLGRSV
ncbi:MAG TPA: hypothetical protein VJ653_07185, partial [Acidimicrobiales bacterium]|nr:hypothetical protein [Acidimicrobiales bacterium]